MTCSLVGSSAIGARCDTAFDDPSSHHHTGGLEVAVQCGDAASQKHQVRAQPASAPCTSERVV